ncbi:endonuclease domain-containing protein [Demequina sp. SO4-18]|uniref:endonuclease domain-containing protein n=1 Tax=Demequina sp. SO4-18 TaxID=3401026 RepID=UPI003B5C9AD2
MSTARAIDISVHCVDAMAQLVMLDHALRIGTCTRKNIAAFTVTPGPRRAWLLAAVDPRSDSVSETCARVALRAAGLDVVSQAVFPGVGRVDLLVEGRVVVECDGRDYHSDPRAFARDRARDRELIARGLDVLRFPYADTVYRPDRVVSDVRRALDASPLRR